jgi:hypothetical protein
MDIRLIFLNHDGGAMEGRSRLSGPAIGGGNPVPGERRRVIGEANPPIIKPESRKDHGSSDPRDPLMPHCLEKLLSVETTMTVPQTDTGRRGEKPKVRERNHIKELGKLAP